MTQRTGPFRHPRRLCGGSRWALGELRPQTRGYERGRVRGADVGGAAGCLRRLSGNVLRQLAASLDCREALEGSLAASEG
jgi:hypothetical protein